MKDNYKPGLARRIKYAWQMVTTGICNQELWNLDCTIAEYVLPRLKKFKEYGHGYPAQLEENEWNIILDKMILSFQLVVDEEDDTNPSGYVSEGLELFGKWFTYLWD